MGKVGGWRLGFLHRKAPEESSPVRCRCWICEAECGTVPLSSLFARIEKELKGGFLLPETGVRSHLLLFKCSQCEQRFGPTLTKIESAVVRGIGSALRDIGNEVLRHG